MFTYNTTSHSSTNFSPFELIFGFKANLPSSISSPPQPVYNYEDYLSELRNRLQICHQMAKESINLKKERSKSYYDKSSNPSYFQVGTNVLYRNHVKKNKLSPIWNGPYEVIKINNEYNTTILINNKPKTVHNNHLKHLNN